MELLLNRRRVHGVTRYLVSWRGQTSTDDEWLREEELVHCRESPRQGPASSCGSPVADYVPAAPRRRAGRWDTPPLLPAAGQPTPPSPRRPPPPAAPPLVVAPASFRLPTPAEVTTAPPYWAGRCCTTGPAIAGFVGQWPSAVGPRGSSTWSGTALGRRWLPLWSTRCSMPPCTGLPATGSNCAQRTSLPVALEGRL